MKRKNAQRDDVQFLGESEFLDESNINQTKQLVNRSWIDRFLSPQALQRMMMCGGGILVLGFVGWLWTIGIFENPIVAATGIGVATLGVLASGIGLFRMTQHKLAGMGLTLLGSLAMPLNLWFYDAQGLITLAEGGHLWIPAAICCGIYALTAHILRQPSLVFTFVGGIVMTGLLLLADQDIGRFMELTGPVTFLVATGWICIFTERFFRDDTSDFSRDRFGNAFKRSGILVMSSGLLLLLGGQLTGMLDGILLNVKIAPLVATELNHKLWAIGVFLISAVGCFAQSFIDKREFQSKSFRNWISSGFALLTWASLCIIDVLQFHPKLAHFAILSGMLAIGANLFVISRRRLVKENSDTSNSLRDDRHDLPSLAAALVCILAGVQFFAQFVVPEGNWLLLPTGWLVVTQIMIAAFTCLTLALRFRVDGSSKEETSIVMLQSAFGVLMTVAMLTVTFCLAVSVLDYVALLVLMVPVAINFMPARQSANSIQTQYSPGCISALVAVGCLVPIAMMPSLLGSSHLTWAWIMSVVAFVSLDWRTRKAGDDIVGFLSATIAVGLVLAAANVSLQIALPGSALIIGVAMTVVNRWLSESSQLPGHLMIAVGCVTSFMSVLSQIAIDSCGFDHVLLLAGQLIALTVVGLSTGNPQIRSACRGLGVATVVIEVLALNSFVEMSFAYRLELASLIVGIALLVIGHIGVARETTDARDDTTSLNLWFGSVLVALPLCLGLLGHRMFGGELAAGWVSFHEIATIASALALFASGVSMQLRSTTLAGAGLLIVYSLSLITLIEWPDQLKSVSVVMMIGGGLFFAGAILLSIYRDRILDLPNQIREKKGVFKVMRWR